LRVYSDAPVPLTEESRTEPGSMHGTMHLARELMLKATVKAPLAVVRSTLIYGEGDPHNGYGPNRFRRLAAAGQEIVLFGEVPEHIRFQSL
jgi:UDP-glucose 4-epimerase